MGDVIQEAAIKTNLRDIRRYEVITGLLITHKVTPQPSVRSIAKFLPNCRKIVDNNKQDEHYSLYTKDYCGRDFYSNMKP